MQIEPMRVHSVERELIARAIILAQTTTQRADAVIGHTRGTGDPDKSKVLGNGRRTLTLPAHKRSEAQPVLLPFAVTA